MNVVITSERNIMEKNNLKKIGLLALSLLTVSLNGAPVTQTNTAATIAGATQANHGEQTAQACEKEAMEYFMHLLTCPLKEAPKWKDFVDKVTRLLTGNPRYADLCVSLLKVRDLSGYRLALHAQKSVADELVKHEACLPKEIVDKVTALGWDLRHRIKI